MTPEPDPQKIPARLVEVSVEVTVEVTVEVEGCVSHDLMPFPILHRLLAWAVEMCLVVGKEQAFHDRDGG